MRSISCFLPVNRRSVTAAVLLLAVTINPVQYLHAQAPVAEQNQNQEAAKDYKKEDVAAVLNGKNITVGEVDQRIQTNPRFMLYKQMAGENVALLNRIRRTALDSLIDRELLLAEANDSKIDDKKIDAAVEQLITQYGGKEKMRPYLEELKITFDDFRKGVSDDFRIEQYINDSLGKDVAVTDQELQAEFRANKEVYDTPEQVHARHILVKVEENASAEEEKTAKEKIEKIHKEATATGANFAELAKKYSEGPTAPQGGDLRYFQRGQMVKPFEDVAFELEPGVVSKPVKTQFGYHIIYVEDHKEAVSPSFEEAKEKVVERLTNVKKRDLLQKHMEELRKDAKVEIKIEADPLSA